MSSNSRQCHHCDFHLSDSQVDLYIRGHKCHLSVRCMNEGVALSLDLLPSFSAESLSSFKGYVSYCSTSLSSSNSIILAKLQTFPLHKNPSLPGVRDSPSKITRSLFVIYIERDLYLNAFLHQFAESSGLNRPFDSYKSIYAITMPTEVHHLPDHDSKPAMTSATLWLEKMKGLSHEEDELAKKIGRENLTAKKPATDQKKTCICAPTNHEGSFRCHLHRAKTEAQNKSDINVKNVLDSDGKHPKLSRFGRDASARACRDSLPLTITDQVK